MALQFSCPYCTAPVRVPDSVAGKLGKCPRCGTAVRIPELPVTDAAQTGVTSAPAPAPASAPPVVATEWPVLSATVPGPTDSPPPLDISSFEFSAPTPRSAPSAVRKEPRKGGGAWIIPLLAVLLVGGFVAYQKLRNRPVYHGALVGERVPDSKAVTVIVRWETIGIDLQSRQALIEYFGHRPGVMVNPMMEMRFGALPGGLEIRFSPGQSADLVRVNPTELKGVEDLIIAGETEWDQSRKAELNAFALQLCQAAVQAHLQGVAVEGLPQYGRPVGINSLIRGFGYHVEAIHDRVRYPCVMEDKDGMLFFLVPESIRAFEVQERSDDAHQPTLPKEFRLTIQVPPTIAETPRLESTTDEEEPAMEAPAPTEPGTEPALETPSSEEGAEGMKSMEMKTMEKSEN